MIRLVSLITVAVTLASWLGSASIDVLVPVP